VSTADQDTLEVLEEHEELFREAREVADESEEYFDRLLKPLEDD
jgi:hypothetical protein